MSVPNPNQGTCELLRPRLALKPILGPVIELISVPRAFISPDGATRSAAEERLEQAIRGGADPLGASEGTQRTGC